MNICLCHQAPLWRLLSHLEMFIDRVFSFLGCTSLLVLCSLAMSNTHTYGHFVLSIESYLACFVAEKQSSEEPQPGGFSWTGACSLSCNFPKCRRGSSPLWEDDPQPRSACPGCPCWGWQAGQCRAHSRDRRRFPGGAGGGSRAPAGSPGGRSRCRGVPADSQRRKQTWNVTL